MGTVITWHGDFVSGRWGGRRVVVRRDNRRVHFVYIVRCADGSLYTGYARDPRARERAHNSGRGAKYTAGRRPVRLVYQEAFRSMGKALAREYVVKQLTRVQKGALIVSARRRHH
jgi:predicted GIY-YIG superfamily endonuclease